MSPATPYYRRDLALVHHLGFGFHADACAPGILALLEPVRARGGLVLEFGCGSGLLTRYLVEAGHRVVATDASPAMLELARETAPGAETIELLRLPDDPIPSADAIVAIGHPISYLDEEADIDRALVALARALRPGGTLAIDICDLSWGSQWTAESSGRVGEAWAIVTRYSRPTPQKFIRDMTTFLRHDDDTWHRADEHHENVLVDTSRLPSLLAPEGLTAHVGTSFGTETLPAGLHTLIATRPE
jgi:SAM-dependent methyltransferase